MVSFSFPAELYLLEDLITPDLLTSILCTNFSRPLDASLRRVCHGAAIGASSLSKLGGRTCLRVLIGDETSLVVGVDGLFFARLLLSLMVEDFGIDRVRCVLIHIPGSILDKLRHVL